MSQNERKTKNKKRKEISSQIIQSGDNRKRQVQILQSSFYYKTWCIRQHLKVSSKTTAQTPRKHPHQENFILLEFNSNISCMLKSSLTFPIQCYQSPILSVLVAVNKHLKSYSLSLLRTNTDISLVARGPPIRLGKKLNYSHCTTGKTSSTRGISPKVHHFTQPE